MESSSEDGTIRLAGLDAMHHAASSMALQAFYSQKEIHIILPVVLKNLSDLAVGDLTHFSRAATQRRPSANETRHSFMSSATRTTNNADPMLEEKPMEQIKFKAMKTLRVLFDTNNGSQTREAST